MWLKHRKIKLVLTKYRLPVTPLSEVIEPFSFDTEQARYLISSSSIDLATDGLKKAFRKSPKSEVLTLHILRDTVAL